jgi:hypothetical protein
LAEIAERAGRLDDARARFEEVFSAGAHPMPGDRVIALAGLARLGARDPQEAARALAESAGSMGAVERLAAHLRIWKACGDTEHLRQAKRLLDHLLEHAPPASRAAMLSRVRNYRETAEAARALA